jgi:tRNA(fMet)-specific endonuclease VapC
LAHSVGEALARGLPLVTNAAEFERVAGMRLEDWTRG